MSSLPFSLKPFRDTGCGAGMAITGSIGRRPALLSVRWELRGDVSTLSAPGRAGAPQRRDRLWEETCFELFLGAEGSAEYREFNLSPEGHWNAYRFDSYRQGMREEPAFVSLPFDVEADSRTLRLSLDVDIRKIVAPDATVDAAVCAVVRTRAGEVSHWALAHPGPRPDFHRRDGFRLKIPASS